jgi:hypothetical protein
MSKTFNDRLSGLPWAREMTALLAEQRQAGVIWFPVAWSRASNLCTRPKPQDRSGARCHDDHGWLPFSEFFQRACEREWNGQVRHDYAGLRELVDTLAA